MNFPENLKYTADHEWIKVEGENALIGITDYAQKELGDIVFVDVTSEGETLNAGEAFGNIEAVKTVSELLMPAGGTERRFGRQSCFGEQRSLRRRLDHQGETDQCR